MLTCRPLIDIPRGWSRRTPTHVMDHHLPLASRAAARIACCCVSSGHTANGRSLAGGRLEFVGQVHPFSNGDVFEKLGIAEVPGKLDSESSVDVTTSRSSRRTIVV